MSNIRKQKAKSFIKQKSNFEKWLLRSSDAVIQAAQDESRQTTEQGRQKYSGKRRKR